MAYKNYMPMTLINNYEHVNGVIYVQWLNVTAINVCFVLHNNYAQNIDLVN